MATGLEKTTCCICGRPATAATLARFEVPSRIGDIYPRYEADPEGPQFWCDDHEPGRKPTCGTCHHWRNRRCTNAAVLDFVKNDPNAIIETPPEFSCHLHERRKIEVTTFADVDEHGNIKRRFEEVV